MNEMKEQKEPPAAIRAFQDYLAQAPPRSLDGLAGRYRDGTVPDPPTRRATTLKEWSRRYGWQERVAAHERRIAEEAEERARTERLAEIEKARKQRIQVARVARGKGVEALAQMAPHDLARLPGQTVRLLEYADSTERKDMGEPDQRVALEGNDGGPLSFTIRIDSAAGPPDAEQDGD